MNELCVSLLIFLSFLLSSFVFLSGVAGGFDVAAESVCLVDLDVVGIEVVVGGGLLPSV